MTSKELKRLSRSDLLEMLLELSRENENLRKEIDLLKEELNSRKIEIAECGSIAEAALQLNRVFQVAQTACEQYAENVKIRCVELEQETKKKCAELLKHTENLCKTNEEVDHGKESNQ